MCYIKTKKLRIPNTHNHIEYCIEWSERALALDETGCQKLFSAKYCDTKGQYEIIGEAATIAEAQSIIDEHYGSILTAKIWIQYCVKKIFNDNEYLIYMTWDDNNNKYIFSVSRNNNNAIPYCGLIDDSSYYARIINGINISKQVMDLIIGDIESGILDTYIDNNSTFIIDEYIIDGTEKLLNEICQNQGEKKCFMAIKFCLNALINGSDKLPSNLHNKGQICLLVRGHVDNNNYEINIQLEYLNNIWKFHQEQILKNNENILYSRRNTDNSYTTKFQNNDDINPASVPYNISQIRNYIPNDFINIAKKIIL